jgi:hypothetical protein
MDQKELGVLSRHPETRRRRSTGITGWAKPASRPRAIASRLSKKNLSRGTNGAARSIDRSQAIRAVRQSAQSGTPHCVMSGCVAP